MNSDGVFTDEVIRIAENRVAIELKDREPVLRKGVLAIKDEFTKRNALGHGRLPFAMVDVIARECDIRAMLVWGVLSRVLGTQSIRIGPRLGPHLKGLVEEWFEKYSDDLKTAYEYSTKSKNTPSSIPALETLKANALAKVRSEIDIQLMAAERTQQTTGQSTVNIYQPFGIIQTGAGATASFSITHDANAMEALNKALDAVQDALAQTHELARAEQAQVSELVAEVKAELQKPAPNGLRVRSALSGIGMAIQTLGSMAAAYNLLKGAAILVGTVIP